MLISRSPCVRHAEASPRHSLSSALRCRTRAKLYVGARKAIEWETQTSSTTAPIRALKSPRRSNNRPADIHGREVDRDGEPGLYPPEGNRRKGISTIVVNDLHERICTMLPESFRITFGDRRFRSRCGVDYSPTSRDSSVVATSRFARLFRFLREAQDRQLFPAF